jgi:hypothetical protein
VEKFRMRAGQSCQPFQTKLDALNSDLRQARDDLATALDNVFLKQQAAQKAVYESLLRISWAFATFKISNPLPKEKTAQTPPVADGNQRRDADVIADSCSILEETQQLVLRLRENNLLDLKFNNASLALANSLLLAIPEHLRYSQCPANRVGSATPPINITLQEVGLVADKIHIALLSRPIFRELARERYRYPTYEILCYQSADNPKRMDPVEISQSGGSQKILYVFQSLNLDALASHRDINQGLDDLTDILSIWENPSNSGFPSNVQDTWITPSVAALRFLTVFTNPNLSEPLDVRTLRAIPEIEAQITVRVANEQGDAILSPKLGQKMRPKTRFK